MIAVAYRKNGAYSTIDTDSTNRLRSVMHRIPCMSQDNTTNHPITDIGTPPTHPHVPYRTGYGMVRFATIVSTRTVFRFVHDRIETTSRSSSSNSVGCVTGTYGRSDNTTVVRAQHHDPTIKSIDGLFG